MANTKSSKKDIKRSTKRRLINTGVRSALKTHIKKVKVAAKTGEANVQENLIAAISALDKAVQRGIIHKNQAARRKSRIAKLASVAGSADAVAAAAAPVKKAAPKAAPKRKAAPKKK